jgi:RNA polymerase sigma-70 factor (ECF subfamily)
MRVEKLQELENPRGFLFRTATNLALDRTRQQTRLARLHRHLELQTRTAQGQPGSPGRTSPEADLQARERIQQVAEVVRKLPYKCGRAFILHRFEGRTHAEIARELGVSRSMVEKYLSRALARLRRELRPGAEDSGPENR